MKPQVKSSAKLLCWYDRKKRNLPWRLTRPHPYKTWISEIMLQQTQIETVLPYYLRFLREFPGVAALAKAPLEKVLTLWSGLGYYARARNLHQTAKILVKQYRGRFPKTKELLLTLPGIGEYTAGAIASIAFGERVPVVDGNVVRVLTRLLALKGDPKTDPLKSRLWKKAATLLPEKRVGDYNQALMELGALVCQPGEPLCRICPLREDCKAFQKGEVAKYPTPQAGVPTLEVFLGTLLIQRKNRYLIAKRGEARHLQSMWEFPQIESPRIPFNRRQMRRKIASRFKIEVIVWRTFSIIKHSIMNRRLRIFPYLCGYKKGEPRIGTDYKAYQWITLEALKDFPTSSLNHKVVRILMESEFQKNSGGGVGFLGGVPHGGVP